MYPTDEPKRLKWSRILIVNVNAGGLRTKKVLHTKIYMNHFSRNKLQYALSPFFSISNCFQDKSKFVILRTILVSFYQNVAKNPICTYVKNTDCSHVSDCSIQLFGLDWGSSFFFLNLKFSVQNTHNDGNSLKNKWWG